MAYDKFFGFDLTQRKTLEKLLAELAGEDSTAIDDLSDQLDALTARVVVLEEAAE